MMELKLRNSKITKKLHSKDTSIKSKIVIIVTVIFAFFIVMSLIFSLYSLDARTAREIEEFRKSEIERTNAALKSYVHIAYTVVETNYKNATDENYLSDYYGDRLRSLLDLAEAILKDKVKAVKSGRLSKKQAQQQAIDLIEQMRYDKGAGYYFIFTNERPYPRMVLEPHVKELNGKVLDDKSFNTAAGSTKNLFVAALDAIGDKNEGFVDYIWPRPATSGSSIDIAKFSYVRMFEEWGWVIGTGIYLDDAIKDCMKKSISDLRTMRYDNGTGYYWINDNTKPTPRLIMNPFIPHLEGQILTDKKYNRAYDEDYNLYEAFLDACEETGDGFVQYKWDKPSKTGIIEDAQKTSYVKYFQDLGWVIGSGVYIDDIDRAINSKIAKMQDQKTSLIINYLLISLTLAAIAISVLVFFMNRYFGDLEKQQAEQLETIAAEHNLNLGADPDKAESVENQDKPAEKEAGEPVVASNDSSSDVSKILEVVLKEQTRQMALAKVAEKESTESELKELTQEIKVLIDEVKNSKQL